MLQRLSVAAVAAACALLLVPAIPGIGEANAQMRMNLASASRRGPGVNAIIEGYSHSVTVPQDAMAARATGRRIHEPFRIRKRVDAATPLLYRAMANSETIPTVTLTIPTTRAARGGPNMTITLTDARIIQIDSSGGDDVPVEEVAFFYNKIKWESSEGGTSFEDNWRENN